MMGAGLQPERTELLEKLPYSVIIIIIIIFSCTEWVCYMCNLYVRGVRQCQSGLYGYSDVLLYLQHVL